MPQTRDRLVMNWIALFGGMAILLVVFGGFVRLTKSGLSIAEWNPVEGAVPPLTDQAWQTEFAKYQLTPEYLQINKGMSLAEYKEIFWIEWIHRILARLAGLVFAGPFLGFLIARRIPWRESGFYVLMGILFLSQAVMGWLMVSSGLTERPSVSHFLLAAHLFLALSLIGLSVWTFLGHLHGFPERAVSIPWSGASKAALATTILLLIQIAYGAFTAGLKGGHTSNSWPLMLGRWIPAGLFQQIEPAWRNLVEAPLTVTFVHRWFAFAVLLAAVLAYRLIRTIPRPPSLQTGLRFGLILGLIQVSLGIAVVLSGVSITMALLHQLNAIALFVVAIFVLHRLRDTDRRNKARA